MNETNPNQESTPNSDDLDVLSTLLEHIKGISTVSGGPLSLDDLDE